MPEAPTQPQPTSNQRSINWKRVLVVVVIGVVLIGLGVVIFLLLQPKEETTSVTPKKATPSAKVATPSAKKDETADWKNFVGNIESIEYSLKYPKSYKPYNITGGSPQINPKNSRFVVFTNQTIEVHLPDYPDAANVTVLNPANDFVRISIVDKNNIDLSDARYADPYYHNYPLKNKTLKEIAAFTRESNITKSVSKVFSTRLADQGAYNYKMTKVKGFSGIGNSHILAGVFDTLTVIYIESKGNIFEILYTPTNAVEKILSTFKFLD